MGKKDVALGGVEGTEPIPMPEPEGGWPADEFTGLGGSYVRDPFTGVRSRVMPEPEPEPGPELPAA